MLHEKGGKKAIVCPKDKEQHMVADPLTLRNTFAILELLEEMKTDESQQEHPGKRQRVNEAESLCKDHNLVCVCAACVNV